MNLSSHKNKVQLQRTKRCHLISEGNIRIRLLGQHHQIASLSDGLGAKWMRRHQRVSLIRRYQVTSADRAGKGCVTSRLRVAGPPAGAGGEPFDPVLMFTSARLIR